MTKLHFVGIFFISACEYKVSGTNLMSLKSILHFADFDVYLGPGNTDSILFESSIRYCFN